MISESLLEGKTKPMLHKYVVYVNAINESCLFTEVVGAANTISCNDVSCNFISGNKCKLHNRQIKKKLHYILCFLYLKEQNSNLDPKLKAIFGH